MQFVAPDLRLFDAAKADVMGMALFADELPPRGTLGLIDWRCLGLVSRMLARGELRGSMGELVLLPGRPRFTAIDKVVLCGAGALSQFSEATFSSVTTALLDAMGKVGGRACVLVLPGQHRPLVPPERAMELLLQVAPERDEVELTLVEDTDAQKRMQPVLDAYRRRQRAATP